MYFYANIPVDFFRVKNISGKSCKEIETHISRSIFFFSEGRSVYEIM